ncbi:hypothetical protein XYCOK13_14380 [Xylanibacillus composti]|uniref:Endolytic transglycosylase MltG n=1 Tax=Xylanibacillus composti TaxID=1572762 RepID=A0A8J4M1I2_9BACL|nr:hypothetical protein [Xylanibacillus composti]GIQ68614.1 hypothetical protein XYCOK13_14380 [Xylanibacillus composti]
MFKNKSLLAGLGIGLIVGTLLLQTMTVAERLENREPEPQMLDEEQLEQAADRLGFSLVVKDAVYYSEDQLAARVEEARQEAIAQAEQTVVERKSFVIVAGTRPANVADMLLTLGLIEDKNQFLNELRERRLTTNILSGLYTFEGKPDLDEIIREITHDS